MLNELIELIVFAVPVAYAAFIEFAVLVALIESTATLVDWFNC